MIEKDEKIGRIALVAVVSLYALWGMAHNLNDILIAQFKRAFDLSDLQSSLVQSAFYFTYVIAPVPAALVMQRFGFKRGVLAGLALYATGAILFWPAAQSVTYSAFLAALFVIACGIVFLETAGTGMIVTMGRPERAEWRINLAQAFNPIGAIAGILIGRQFIFSGEEATAAQRAAMSPEALAAYRAAEAQAVQWPYACIAAGLVLFMLFFASLKFPASVDASEANAESPTAGFRRALGSRMLMLGVGAQFFYVGTQIGVWSFLIRYVQQVMPGTDARTAALYLTVSLVVFLTGRFVVLLLLRRWSSTQIAMVFSVCAAALTLFGIFYPGQAGAVALVGSSAFMSVMYPAIYATGLHGHEKLAKPASALMTMSIVGGAVLTAAMGAISDASTIAQAYVVPLVGFVVVFAYTAYAVKSGRVGAAIGGGH